MKSPLPDCVFCERVLKRCSHLVWDQPLAETHDYLVVPSKGALVPGWVLVVSKEHFLCTGALPLHTIRGLMEALTVAKRLVEPKFGPATLFEHGPATNGTTLGCGVDHLHVHAVPLSFSLQAAFKALYTNSLWSTLADWRDLGYVHGRHIPYVTIQEPGQQLRWCIPPNNTRQPLRRAVASAIGVEDRFDYNLYPYIENVTQTIEQLTAV